MSRGKELAKNTTIIFVGRFCTHFLSFLLLPLYTYVLNTSEYGTVDIIITYISLIVPCVTLELSSALFRFLVDKRDKKEEATSIISFVVFATIIITFLFCVLFGIIASIFRFKYLWVCLFLIIATTSSNVALQLIRGLGNYFSYSLTSVIIGVMTLVLNVLFLTVLKTGASGMLVSLVIAHFCGSFYAFVSCQAWNYISIRSIKRTTSKELLRYSIPLIPNSVIWWVVNVSDRTIITAILDVAANGIYAVSTKFPGIISNILSVFNLSWQETVSLHINDSDGSKFISSTFNKLVEFFSSLCMGMIAVMWIAFPILISDAYNDAYSYIPILAMGSFCSVIVNLIGAIYVGLKRTKEIAITSLWAGVINIVINLLFIKNIGIYAAAISTLVAFLAMAIYRIVSIRKYFRLEIDKMMIIRCIAGFSIFTFIYYINTLVLNIVGTVAACIYALAVNWKFVKKLVKVKS